MKNKYITCYIGNNEYLSPMGDSKDWKYAVEIAKKHKHILCKLVPIKDYSNKNNCEKNNIL